MAIQLFSFIFSLSSASGRQHCFPDKIAKVFFITVYIATGNISHLIESIKHHKSRLCCSDGSLFDHCAASHKVKRSTAADFIWFIRRYLKEKSISKVLASILCKISHLKGINNLATDLLPSQSVSKNKCISFVYLFLLLDCYNNSRTNSPMQKQTDVIQLVFLCL